MYPPRVPGDPKTQLDTFLRALEDARRVAREANERVERMEHALRLLESAAGEVLGGLPSPGKRAIVREQMQVEEYRSGREVGRKLGNDHPFKRALKAADVTVTEWAKAHKVSRAKVKSWLLDGNGARAIPREYANKIERDFGVPATVKSWPHGIRE